MEPQRPGGRPALRRLGAACALVALVMVAHWPILGDLLRYLRLDELSPTAVDAATHFLRIQNARELYLPSGHHFGWNPFWYQGYVPFLLYPHLTYVAVALAGMVLPMDPVRLFHAYTVLLYFALPLGAGLLLLRSGGLAAALVAAAWFCTLSTVGAGLRAVFTIGLITQQAGVLLFGLLAYDLVVARRLDRGAIWLGLIPLVHVHTALVAAIVWLAAGIVAMAASRDRRRELRQWFEGGVIALFVASPTVVGLVHGWGNVGTSTSYEPFDDMLGALASGLVAPAPTLVAVLACAALAVVVAPRSERWRGVVWGATGLLLLGLSVHKWEIGSPTVDRVLGSMLYLRTWPFAFVWLAALGLSGWSRFPRPARIAVGLLTIAGVVAAWPLQERVAGRLASSWDEAWAERGLSVADYRSALDWIASDLDGDVATLAISVDRPRGRALLEAIERLRLPLIGGHGAELTDVHNSALVARPNLPCPAMRLQVRNYAVGYLVGTDPGQVRHVEECLGTTAAAEFGQWWVVATGRRWGRIAGGAVSFTRNATWTEMTWRFQRRGKDSSVVLPVASTGPWSADVDGAPIEISASGDDTMAVTVPAGGKRLRLRFDGYAGEWESVAVSCVALLFAVLRMRRIGAAAHADDRPNAVGAPETAS